MAALDGDSFLTLLHLSARPGSSTSSVSGYTSKFWVSPSLVTAGAYGGQPRRWMGVTNQSTANGISWKTNGCRSH